MAKRVIQTFSEAFIKKVEFVYDKLKSLSMSDGRQVADFLPDGPDDYVCYTPSAGIAAMSGTTVYNELCTVYRLTGTPADGYMTLEKITNGDGSDFQVRVHNISSAEVNGDKYIVTARLKGGARYVVLEAC